MKRATTVSSGIWFFLAVSMSVLGGVLAVRHFRPVEVGFRAELAALQAERDSLPAVDESELARWRQRQVALASEAWTEAALGDFQNRLGDRWTWTELPAEPRGRSFQICPTVPANLRWSELLAAVASMETSGMKIEALDIGTAGTRTVRSFSRVEIRVSLKATGAGPGRTAAPVSPNPDRRARVLPMAGEEPATVAGDRARPAAPRSAVHSAARHGPGRLRFRLRALARPARPPAARPGGRVIIRRDQPNEIP